MPIRTFFVSIIIEALLGFYFVFTGDGEHAQTVHPVVEESPNSQISQVTLPVVGSGNNGNQLMFPVVVNNGEYGIQVLLLVLNDLQQTILFFQIPLDQMQAVVGALRSQETGSLNFFLVQTSSM